MGNRSRIERYPQLVKAIAASVAAGSHPIAAGRKYGVPRRTLQGWLEIGYNLIEQEPQLRTAKELLSHLSPELKRHERRCVQLVCEIEQALGSAEDEAAKRHFIKEPGRWLEHGPARERWRRESKVEIDGSMAYTESAEIPCPAPLAVLAQGLAELEALGLDVCHDPKLFRQLPRPADSAKTDILDIPSSTQQPPPPGGNGNGRQT